LPNGRPAGQDTVLSVSSDGTDVELFGYNDGSGRQWWIIPNVGSNLY